MAIHGMYECDMPEDAYEMTFTKVLNDYGSGSFKVKRKAYKKGECLNEAGILLCSIGDVFRCKDIHNNIVFEFIYEKESWVINDGYYEITYSGAGIMSVLEHAKLWPDPTYTKLLTNHIPYKFQYPYDSDITKNIHTIDMSKYGANSLSVQGVYMKSYGQTITNTNGTKEYIATEPRLVGRTIGDIVNNYSTETQNRNTNRVDMLLSSTVPSTTEIGEYKKECGSSYADIFKEDIANQLGMFIRDEYDIDGLPSIKLYQISDLIKSVTLSNDDRIYDISGDYNSKENYQSFLTASNDVMISCRLGDDAPDGKEGVLPIADYFSPDNHVAYAKQFINHNTGSTAFNMVITGEGLEPLKDFDVGDLLTVSIPTDTGAPLQIATENRVLSITYNVGDTVTATVELNMNDKAETLINLPAILKQEQQIRENTLKARMPNKDLMSGLGVSKDTTDTSGNTQILDITTNSGTHKKYKLLKDGNGHVIKITDDTGKEVPISWVGL